MTEIFKFEIYAIIYTYHLQVTLLHVKCIFSTGRSMTVPLLQFLFFFLLLLFFIIFLLLFFLCVGGLICGVCFVIVCSLSLLCVISLVKL